MIPLLGGGTFPRSSVTVTKTTKISLRVNDNAAEDPSKIYNMLMTDESISMEPTELLRKIQRDKDNILKSRLISPEHIAHDEPWRHSHTSSPYTEAKMIQRSKDRQRAVFSTLNEPGMRTFLSQTLCCREPPRKTIVADNFSPATPTLRAALRCKNPNMDNLLGNRFMFSRSTEPYINQFHIAGGPGPLSPLQMNKYAAYTLNYHHAGAPRILTVTLPEQHEKVEEFMYMSQESGNLFVRRPSTPPPCSHFVAHRPMYVPQGTLDFYGVKYTQVVQYPGELVITFPYAYHQAYASARNITEEIGYASERCKVFHLENLYQHCSPNCSAGKPDDFNWSDVFTHTLTSRSNALLHRSAPESPPAFFSSREPSAGHSQNTPAPRMTSNPHEHNTSDPASASGDLADDDDDCSPIGGIIPRDPVTGRPLMPHEVHSSRRRARDDDDGADGAPRKHRRR